MQKRRIQAYAYMNYGIWKKKRVNIFSIFEVCVCVWKVFPNRFVTIHCAQCTHKHYLQSKLIRHSYGDRERECNAVCSLFLLMSFVWIVWNTIWFVYWNKVGAYEIPKRRQPVHDFLHEPNKQFFSLKFFLFFHLIPLLLPTKVTTIVHFEYHRYLWFWLFSLHLDRPYIFYWFRLFVWDREKITVILIVSFVNEKTYRLLFGIELAHWNSTVVVNCPYSNAWAQNSWFYSLNSGYFQNNYIETIIGLVFLSFFCYYYYLVGIFIHLKPHYNWYFS